jgi:hypothetical protein
VCLHASIIISDKQAGRQAGWLVNPLLIFYFVEIMYISITISKKHMRSPLPLPFFSSANHILICLYAYRLEACHMILLFVPLAIQPECGLEQPPMGPIVLLGVDVGLNHVEFVEVPVFVVEHAAAVALLQLQLG